MMSRCPAFLSHVRIFTSFCNLGKCQACAALKVDVLAVNKRAERIQRLASKEVGLGSLQVTFNISKRVMTDVRVTALRMA
jgi:hypothetical protein